jgi:hypothetical protein
MSVAWLLIVASMVYSVLRSSESNNRFGNAVRAFSEDANRYWEYGAKGNPPTLKTPLDFSPLMLMENFDPGNRVNFFTGRAPDFLDMRIRVRGIAFMHRIVKEPAGDQYATSTLIRSRSFLISVLPCEITFMFCFGSTMITNPTSRQVKNWRRRLRKNRRHGKVLHDGTAAPSLRKRQGRGFTASLFHKTKGGLRLLDSPREEARASH